MRDSGKNHGRMQSAQGDRRRTGSFRAGARPSRRAGDSSPLERLMEVLEAEERQGRRPGVGPSSGGRPPRLSYARPEDQARLGHSTGAAADPTAASIRIESAAAGPPGDERRPLRRRVRPDPLPAERVAAWGRRVVWLMVVAAVAVGLWRAAVPPVLKQGLEAVAQGLLSPPGPLDAAGTPEPGDRAPAPPGNVEPQSAGADGDRFPAANPRPGEGEAAHGGAGADSPGSGVAGPPESAAASPGGAGASRDEVGNDRAGTAPLPPVSFHQEVTLLVGGDILLGESLAAGLGQAPDPLFPFGKLARHLREADIAVAHLAGLMTIPAPEEGDTAAAAHGAQPAAQPLAGPPPSVLMPAAAVPILAAAGFDVMGVANAHAGAADPQALMQTLRLIAAGQMVPVGAGRSRADLLEPVVVEQEGVRIAFVAFTDRAPENALAATDQPGVLGSHEETLVALVEGARQAADVVVVLAHWGPELTPVPAPEQRRLARKVVSAGADVVLGTGPQVEQTVEWLQGRPVIYSLGHLARAPLPEQPGTQQGVLARLRIGGGAVEQLDLLRVPLSAVGEPGPPVADDPPYWLELRADWVRIWQGLPGAARSHLIRAQRLPRAITCPQGSYQVVAAAADGVRLERQGYVGSQLWITDLSDGTGCAQLPEPLLQFILERVEMGTPVEVPLEPGLDLETSGRQETSDQ